MLSNVCSQNSSITRPRVIGNFELDFKLGLGVFLNFIPCVYYKAEKIKQLFPISVSFRGGSGSEKFRLIKVSTHQKFSAHLSFRVNSILTKNGCI